MKTKIAFYISNHGFGHASRNIPIIKYILKMYPDLEIIVRTGENQGRFIKNALSLYHDRLEFCYDNIDIGLILKDGTLEINQKELEIKLKEYIDSWEERIVEEIEFLKQNSVQLVVSDIVPWVFKSANKLKIPSILISNFTWVDIYKEYFGSYIYNEYKECYELADKALLYSLYIDNMKTYLQDFEEVGLCCRSFNEDKIKMIRKEHKRKIVFISVGRSVQLKDMINVEKLKYHFIVTEGINIEGNNVTYLPKETSNTQDYIKASDYIITKAGWGTVAEVLCANKKCAVLSRNSIAEDRNTIEKLKNMNLALEVKYEKGFDIENILKNLDNLGINNKEYKFKNQYKDIASKIISYIGER